MNFSNPYQLMVTVSRVASTRRKPKWIVRGDPALKLRQKQVRSDKMHPTRATFKTATVGLWAGTRGRQVPGQRSRDGNQT